MAAFARTWTPDEVRERQHESRAWPRYELVDGELLVSPAPGVPHQRFVAELFTQLRMYTDAYQLGETLMSPADIALDAASVLQPDIFVIPPGVVVNSWPDVSALLLAVEALSPSTARHDRVTKRQFFQRHDVKEYWIADLDAAVIERWRRHDFRPEVLSDQVAWQPNIAVPALTVDLPALFARATRLA